MTQQAPQAPGTSFQNKNIHTKTIALVIVGTALLFWAALGFPIPHGEHDISMGRGTIVLKTTILGQSITTNQVAVSEGIKGKYPAGQQMIITYPLANSGLSSLKITRFEMHTAGFKFAKSEPVFPIIAPATGSTIIKIYIDTPSQPYTGPLDYTIYLETGI